MEILYYRLPVIQFHYRIAFPNPHMPHSQNKCERSNNYLDWASGVGRTSCYMLLVGAGSAALLLLAEYGVLGALRQRLCAAVRPPPRAGADDSDAFVYSTDVLAERRLVANMAEAELVQQPLVVRNVCVQYGAQRAVHQLSVCVRAGDCLGLMGANGSGRSSTFAVLTGAQRVSGGDAWVLGASVRTQLQDVYRHIGYCPQSDGLLDELTGRQTLRMFCALRGVRRADVRRLTNGLATELGMKRHWDKRVATYSGGFKRKLSTAVALIGCPAVVFLDEPTTGMDPRSRRRLWGVVMRLRQSGRAVVMTSNRCGMREGGGAGGWGAKVL